MKQRQFLKIAMLVAALSLPCMTFAADSSDPPLGQFTLWQLPAQTGTQIMSYVMQSDGGQVIVIDGGMTGDAAYLRGFLADLGNHVDAWFISHAHTDHIDAITSILYAPGELEIDNFYASLPDSNWIKTYEPQSLYSIMAFNQAVINSGNQVIDLALGENLYFDGIGIEILGVKNPEITANAVNNSSMVMRISSLDKTVLFPGDLGVEGGQKLLGTPYATRLAADYVQMAHHGQNGVDKNFYIAVAPEYCLWPTPLWLWNNDNGGGIDSGPWKTLEVRAWMEDLGVKDNYVMCDGLHEISPTQLGDANRDGQVDGSDVTILAGNWQYGVTGTSDATWTMGDFNGDGKVDGSDVTILAGNWQAGVTSDAASVPEPGTMLLLLSVLGSLLVWKRVRLVGRMRSGILGDQVLTVPNVNARSPQALSPIAIGHEDSRLHKFK